MTVTGAPVVLSIRGLSKTFHGNRVLRDVSVDLRAGEIHALVGENGSGKSTLIKCLAGFHVPDPGASIAIDDMPLPLPYTPADALRYGLGFVHQNLGLIPTLSVADNLGLYRRFGTATLGPIRREKQRQWARAALAGFASHIDADARVSELAQADKTLVAIARGLVSGSERRRVLVLDEPTAALPREEVDYLCDALRRVAALGVALVFVSHRLDEVVTLADRVTVLRDGGVVAAEPAERFDESRLVEWIVGRSIAVEAKTPRELDDAVFVDVRGLCGPCIDDVGFAMRRGEIVGVAGLLGSGRSELARLLFGAQTRTGGTVRIDGKSADAGTPAAGLAAGIGYVPEDRIGKGGVGNLSLAENVTLPRLGPVWRAGRLRRNVEREIAADIISRFRVRPADPAARFASLSGGNQQKLIIARALRLRPKLLILDEPAQGVDIGSKLEIFQIVRRAAADGTAVLLIDSNLDDLCRLSDRVLVFRRGRIARELSGQNCTPHDIQRNILTETHQP